MFLSIVIALYNEEGNVKELTERIYASMNSLGIPFELIYVIDGTDNSFKIADELRKSKDNMKVDYSPKLRGFKNAFVKGFEMVDERATHIMTLDGDLNHQPEGFKRFIDEINTTDNSIILGSRYVEEGKMELALWRRMISMTANFIIKNVWGIKIRDKTSGYRLYEREVIDKVIPYCKSYNFEFLFEILIVARKLNYKAKEIPIIFKPRTSGKSKFSLLRTGKGYLKLMFRHF